MNESSIRDAIHDWVRIASGLKAKQIVWEGQRALSQDQPYISMDLPLFNRLGLDWVDQEENPLEFDDQEITDVNEDAADSFTIVGHPFKTGDGPIRFTTTGTLPSLELNTTDDFYLIVVNANVVRVASSLRDANSGVFIPLTVPSVGTHHIVDTEETVRVGEELTHLARGPRTLTLSMQCFNGDAWGDDSNQMILERVCSRHVLPEIQDILNGGGVGVGTIQAVQKINGIKTQQFDPRAVVSMTIHIASEVSMPGRRIDRVEVTNEINDPDTTQWIPTEPE